MKGIQMRVLDDKQPYEEYYIAFDFVNVIGTAVIVSATVSAIDSLGADATSVVTTVANQSIHSPQVDVWIKGGVSGEHYTITCKIATNTTPPEKYELEAELPVVEITKY